jgi:hypothetical protein
MTFDDLLGEEIKLFRRIHTLETELESLKDRLMATRCSIEGFQLAQILAEKAKAAAVEKAAP